MVRLSFLTILLLLFVVTSKAQLLYPKASPHCIINQQAGLTSFTIDYSRPAARGRKVFGHLVPYGRIWRVGANESTKFKITEEVEVMGNTLPAGIYALYAFPEKEEWEVVFHSNISHWGDGRDNYNPDEDVFRIKVVPEKIKDFQENFTITFNEINYDTLFMDWEWEYTRIRIPIKLGTHEKMMEQITVSLRNQPDAITYYHAARYFEEQKTDADQCIEWLDKAEALEGPSYYVSRVKSLCYARLGDYQKAINEAVKSKDIAASLGKDEFVRMNDENIKKWSLKQRNK